MAELTDEQIKQVEAIADKYKDTVYVHKMCSDDTIEVRSAV